MTLSGRGGRNKGTLVPTWNYGKTKAVRVPIALEATVKKLARSIDKFGDEDIIAIPKKDYEQALELLKESLGLKAHSGGRIKRK